ncbi:O-antigen ligase [Pontiellaceae bacterium B1224]|nr:O-antigen ligase [Pontiellaceae bacterium B1224]
MSALLLFILTICSFLFYGVVGPDKSWVLGPVFLLAYAAVSCALIKKSWQLSAVCRNPELFQTSNRKLPTSSTLWLLFLLWGITLIPAAVMPFDAKVRMLFFGAVIGAYIVWGQELTSFKDNRIVLGWLIFFVMLTALYGLVVHIKSPESILWNVRYTDHYDGRLASTYICPNHFAHLMQMLLPFCLALLFIPQAGLYLKILAGYSFLIFMPPLFLSESRAGWLGSIAGIGVVVCLMALRRSKKLFAALVIIVPLCSLLLLFGAWRYSETFQRRMTPVVQFLQAQSNGGVGSDSPDFRPLTWMDTLDMISASPVSGFGPGTFRYAYPEFRNRFKGNQIVTGHPHNEYLELTAEFGWIGFGLFALAWIYGSVWVLVKSLRAEETRHAFFGFAFLGAVAGSMVHSFFDFEMHVFPNAIVFALLAALAVGPLRRASRRGNQKGEGRAEANSQAPDNLHESQSSELPESRQSRTSNFKPGMLVAFSWLLSIAFLGGTAFCMQTMTSSIFRHLADRKVDVKPVSPERVGQAEIGYQRAVKLDRTNWRAYQGMGKLKHNERWYCLDMEEKIRLAEEERGWYEQALLYNPKDPESLIGLGRCLLFLSRIAERGQGAEEIQESAVGENLETRGLGLLREACRYRKFNDHYWWMLGIELRKSGQYAAALTVFQQMETVKRTPSSRKNIQWLEKKLTNSISDGDLTKAEEITTRAQELKTSDLINQLDADVETESGSLEDLFQLMEP